MTYKVVITDLEHPSIDLELEVLAGIDAQVEWHYCTTEEDIIAGAADAEALLVGFAPITGRVLDDLPRCRIVARYGIGMDMIDIEAATQRGVVVTNVPDYCLDEVADHTLGLLLACARKLLLLDWAVRDRSVAGEDYWKTAAIAKPLYRLSSQTLGIIGLGQIGRRVARRAQAFGMRVIAAPDPGISREEAKALDVTMLSLEEVLHQADYLTLHAPLTEETHHLINSKSLALMKPSATIINTSRGPIIDEAALVDALQNGWLSHAALDVYEQEPLHPDNALCTMNNVLLSSHGAWYSEDALLDLKMKTVQAIVDFLQGRVPRYVLNPAVLVSPTLRQESHRSETSHVAAGCKDKR